MLNVNGVIYDSPFPWLKFLEDTCSFNAEEILLLKNQEKYRKTKHCFMFKFK